MTAFGHHTARLTISTGKQTEIGTIPLDWTTTTCEQVSRKITVGIVVRPSQYYAVSGVPALRSANVRERGIDRENLVFISERANAIQAKSRVETGDIVTVRTGYPGTSAVIPPDLHGANCIDILITRVTEHVVPAYLAFWINSPVGKSQVLRNQGGLAQQHFNVGDLRNLIVAWPPTLAEQQAIATALSDADALIESLEQLLTKKRQIKQGAMQELLTGKCRLPGFQGDWTLGSLGDVVHGLIAGVSVNSDEDLLSADAYVLKTSALSDGQFLPHQSKPIARSDWARARTNPRADSILISRMNTPDLVGEVGYVPKDFPSLFLPDRLWMTQFRSDVQVNARWLCQLLNSTAYKRRIRDSATGTSGSMKNISKDSLLSLPIQFPEFQEQTAIASMVADMDTEIASVETKLTKARQIKQGMMQELLTGRIRLI